MVAGDADLLRPHRSYDAVTWYYVPGEDAFVAPSIERPVLGYWDATNNWIVVLEYVPNRSALIRHEALHAVLGRTDHPEEFFVTRCGGAIGGPGLPD